MDDDAARQEAQRAFEATGSMLALDAIPVAPEAIAALARVLNDADAVYAHREQAANSGYGENPGDWFEHLARASLAWQAAQPVVAQPVVEPPAPVVVTEVQRLALALWWAGFDGPANPSGEEFAAAFLADDPMALGIGVRP